MPPSPVFTSVRIFHKKVSCHVLVIKASEIYSKEYFSHFTVVGLPNFFLLKKTKIISRHERFGDFPQLLCVLKRGIFCMLCSSQHFYLHYLVALEGELYQESNKPMHQCKKGTGRYSYFFVSFLPISTRPVYSEVFIAIIRGDLMDHMTYLETKRG